MSEFAEQFYKTLRKARPHVLVSVSSSPYPWSAQHHATEWPAWAKSGWMDEFVPQLYRDNYALFEKDWPEQIDCVGDRKSDLVAGLRIVGDGPDTPWDDLKKMAELVRQRGGGGHCWWFSRGVLESYPEQLRQFYDISQTCP